LATGGPNNRPLIEDLWLDNPACDHVGCGLDRVKGKRGRGQANLSPGVQAGEHRLRRRISERLDAGLKAGLLAGGDDVIVVSR
jgi:hypothetical protein